MKTSTRILRFSSMLLLAVISPLFFQSASATLYLSEPFDYPPGPLTNAAPYTPYSQIEASPTLLIVTNDLYYPPLTDPLPVNHCLLQWSSNVKGERQIPGGPIGGPASGTSVYASFILYEVTTNGTTANTPIVGLCVNSTETINQAAVNGPVLYYNQSGGVGFYHLGIKVGGGTSGMSYPPGTQVYATGNTNTGTFGQTNFVVMKYTFSSAGTPGSDTVQLWVNPDPGSFGGSEPAPTTNDVAAINNGTDASAGLDYFQVRAAAGGNAAGTLQMDDLRIGTTWADVTPTCSPAGIVTPPSNQSVSPGQTATFTVVASGANPTFQWQTNNGSGFANIGGATSSIYTTPPTTLGNSGLQFRCVVSVSCDSTTTNSPVATLTVESCVPAGVGATSPTNQTVNEGDTATFSVTASGTSPTYQWQTNNGSGFVNIGGATSPIYTTPPTTLGNSGLQFQCVVSVACDSTTATSAPATLNVVCNTAGVSNPQDQTIVAGQTATFSVIGSGSHPTYQWSTNNGLGGPTGNIIGATNASYTTPPEPEANYGYQFICTVSVACDNSTAVSAPANLIVNCDAATTSDPANTAVAVGQTARFSVTGGGSLPTYQWQTNNGSGWVNINGATNSSYTTPPATLGNSGLQFECVVTACGPTTATSAAATLSVYPANGDFQSTSSGNLNSPTTWEVSFDGGSTFTNPAPYGPMVGNATNVVVESGNTVANTANVLLSNVVVQAGGEITVNSGTTLTITNGLGASLDISGIVDVSGTLTITAGASAIVELGGYLETEQGGTATANGSLTFRSGATYQDNHTTGVSAIPTATWNAGSTCLIAGYTTNTTTLAGLTGQTLYNFIWDCTSQASALPFGGTVPTAVDGSFTVESTGTGEIRLSQNNSPVWNIAGNLNVLGGHLTMAAGTGKPVINVTNNVYIASGAELSNSLASAGATINFVQKGTQMFTNNGTIIGPINWVIENGSTLIGNGVLSSNLTVASGGQLRLTMNPALFSVAGNLKGSNGTVVVDLGGSHLGSGSYPLLDFGGTFGGTLVPSIVNGSVSGTPAIDTGVPNLMSLAVISGAPKVSSFTLSGTNINISGSGGTSGVSYGILESTNLLLPLSQWAPVVRGALFNGSGNFNTNIVNTGASQEFLIIRSPSP